MLSISWKLRSFIKNLLRWPNAIHMKIKRILPTSDPYSSTLIEIWPYQLTGWNFTNRATKGRLKEFFTTVFLSLAPRKS